MLTLTLVSVCTFLVFAQDAAIQDAINLGVRDLGGRVVEIKRVPITNPEIKLSVLGSRAGHGWQGLYGRDEGQWSYL